MPIHEPSPMSIALDRAMKAADTDPLVEAVEAMRDIFYLAENMAIALGKLIPSGSQDGNHPHGWPANWQVRKDIDRARAVLAKYRPQS